MYSAVEWLDAEAYQRDNPNVNQDSQPNIKTLISCKLNQTVQSEARHRDNTESQKWVGFGIYGNGMDMWHQEILDEAFEKFKKTQSGKTAKEKIEGFVKVQNAAYQ